MDGLLCTFGNSASDRTRIHNAGQNYPSFGCRCSKSDLFHMHTGGLLTINILSKSIHSFFSNFEHECINK